MTKECPFCHAKCTIISATCNLICDCGAKYYVIEKIWLNRKTGERLFDKEAAYRVKLNDQPTKECPYCKDRTVVELPLKSNCDTSRVGALIAQGDKKKEIVFWSPSGTYGIEIDFCPKCGKKMKGGTE